MENLIEIHIICYNEHIMLPFTINHYRRMFKNPKFTVHNNISTDDSKEIALALGCEVVDFVTEGMNDTIQSKIKSEAYLNCKAQWYLCIDCDECCLITEEDLLNADFNICQFEGWNIFDSVNSPFEVKVPMGIQDSGYSKPCCIKAGEFSQVLFAAGAHKIDKLIPNEGIDIVWSKNEFKLLHYKHWSCKYNIDRSKELGARQSDDNKRKNHSFHFSLPEKVHIDWFNQYFANRQVIEDKRLELLKVE